LGTAADVMVARRLGRRIAEVRRKREELGIPPGRATGGR
jgi:hypothetical protein